ncbi:GNAT family N-acetyltransferase [Streptomyces sp. Edi2]|uniref:GNAT family N-acetyltransferase n=1 Tax=Streptomyces sp. Edi2 TaxID=3162528 RepID=UPI0033062DAB
MRHTTGKPLTLDQAHEEIRTALARAARAPRAQWSWGILATDEMIGLIALRRRAPSLGTLSSSSREDTWGNGYATEAVKHVTAFAIATAGLERREAMHTPTIRPPAESWPKPVHPHPHFRPARRRRNRRAVPGVCTAVARSSTPLLLITDWGK